VKRWINRYGDSFTEELLKANNNKPTLYLRVNTLKTNTAEMGNLLNNVQLKFSISKYLPNFIRLHNLTNIADWEYFAKGYFAIQDESTAFSCRLLDIKPGQRVLDLCAAPGGKTGLLAEMMENKGELVALDKYESRLNILMKNMERLGVTNITFKEVDSAEYKDELFDRVLVDVPCSGLGTLTKKPDIKWKRDIGDLRKITPLQLELLENGARLLKPGGYLVYSTCTIEPEENYLIIKKFLEKNPDFELVNAKDQFDENLLDENGCVQTYPHIHLIDGAFAAKIKRIN
jgi:16S rRNA (cytosine967-C5)-methyltransferase